jgi:hypothetical protein
MTMVCGYCGKTGMEWKGPMGNLTHTECPHCGGINCQSIEFEVWVEPSDMGFGREEADLPT